MLRKVVGGWADPLRGLGICPPGGRRFGGGCRDVPETETGFSARTVVSFGCCSGERGEGPNASACTCCEASTGTEASTCRGAHAGPQASTCRGTHAGPETS